MQDRRDEALDSRGTRALKICRHSICITKLKRNYCKQDTYCITANTSAEFEILHQGSKIENTRNIIAEKTLGPYRR